MTSAHGSGAHSGGGEHGDGHGAHGSGEGHGSGGEHGGAHSGGHGEHGGHGGKRKGRLMPLAIGVGLGVFLFDAWGPDDFNPPKDDERPPAATAEPFPSEENGVVEVDVPFTQAHVDDGLGILEDLVEAYCPEGSDFDQSVEATADQRGTLVVRVGETVVLECVDPR